MLFFLYAVAAREHAGVEVVYETLKLAVVGNRLFHKRLSVSRARELCLPQAISQRTGRRVDLVDVEFASSFVK